MPFGMVVDLEMASMKDVALAHCPSLPNQYGRLIRKGQEV